MMYEITYVGNFQNIAVKANDENETKSVFSKNEIIDLILSGNTFYYFNESVKIFNLDGSISKIIEIDLEKDYFLKTENYNVI